MSHYVCQELIEEIFKKLPVKSLVRFRSLSKYWYSYIASSDFIRMHDLRKTQEEKVLIQHLGTNNILEDIFTLHSEDRLPLDPGHGYIGITGVKFTAPAAAKYINSCNGILCFIYTNNHKYNNICLWNFSIRRKLTLPAHPTRFEILDGFGFDPIHNDYKIVGTSSHQKRKAFTYSMKTDSWSEIAYPRHSIISLDVKSRPCFFNGTLHWVVNDYIFIESSNLTRDYIMTFNLSSNVFDKILLPTQPEGTNTTQVTVINGSLAVVSHISYDDTFIWVMKEYNNVKSWYVHFTGKMGKFHEVKVLQPIKKNVDFVFKIDHYRGSQVYKSPTGLISKVLNFTHFFLPVEMQTYAESLWLLDRGTSCGETVLPSKENECRKRKSKWQRYDFNDDDDDFDWI